MIRLPERNCFKPIPSEKQAGLGEASWPSEASWPKKQAGLGEASWPR